MPEDKLTELEKEERGRALAAATNSLETSMRSFLLDTYLRAIPRNKFGGFWCALGSNKASVPPVVERKTMLPYMGQDFRRDAAAQRDPAFWLKNLPNRDFYAAVVAACGADPDEELRRNILGCLDITGFFKFSFLDGDYAKLMGGTVYGMLAMRYAKVSAMPQNRWDKLNKRARDGRNDKIGHVNSHTYREMTVAEWRTAMDAWVSIADCLHDAQNDALYNRLMADIDTAEKLRSNALYTLKDLADASGSFTPEEVADILVRYHYQVVNGTIFCDKQEALHCLSDAAKMQELERALADIRAEKAQTRREVPMAAEAAVVSAALEKRLQKVPQLTLLSTYKGEPLEGRTLQELAATHYIVLTASVLKSPDGRSFVSSQLLPALKLAGRDPKKALIVDSTALYHLFRQREEYAKLTEQYRSTFWTPQREAERLELWQRCKELRSADSAYFFVRDLKLPTLGTPDPLSTEEESLLAVMASHPFDRFCVLLCGAAGFVRMIDRKQLPFVQVGRVRIGAQRRSARCSPSCCPRPALRPMNRCWPTCWPPTAKRWKVSRPPMDRSHRPRSLFPQQRNQSRSRTTYRSPYKRRPSQNQNKPAATALPPSPQICRCAKWMRRCSPAVCAQFPVLHCAPRTEPPSPCTVR